MPVTAKLSKLFYDRLGDEVVDELVDWLNATDSGYRTALRELNDTNFARFDARLEQRFAEHWVLIEHRFAEHDARIDRRFAVQDARIDTRVVELEARIDKRFVELEARFDNRFADVEASVEKLELRVGSLERAVDRLGADLREYTERALKEQTRWMFVAWGSLLIPIIGLWFRG